MADPNILANPAAPIDDATNFLNQENPQLQYAQPTDPVNPTGRTGFEQTVDNIAAAKPAVEQAITAAGFQPQAPAQPQAAPVQPPVNVKPSDLDTSHYPSDPLAGQKRDITSALPGDKNFDALKDYEAGYQLQQKGIAGAAQAQQDTVTAQAQMAKSLQDKFEQEQAHAELRQQQLQKAGDQAVSSYQEVQNKLKDFKFQDYWADKSTGQKVMAGIALALGGIGGAYTGKGDNKALDVINQSIDRDLNLQKLNYMKLKDQGEGTRSLYGMYMDKFRNESLAEQATHAALLQSAQNQLAQTVAPYQNKEIQARAQLMSGQLEQQHASAMVGLQRQAAVMKIANGQTGADMKNLDPGTIQALEQSGMPQFKDLSKRYVPGYGPAANEEIAKEFGTYARETKPLVDALDGVIKLTKNFNQFSPQQRAELQSQLTFLAPRLVKAAGANRTTETEINQVGEAMSDPTKFSQLRSTSLARMKVIRKLISDELNKKAKQSGFSVPTEQVQNTNPFNK